MKQKRPQIGDLVRIMESDSAILGIVTGHYGIRSEVQWNDGTEGMPLRAALEVL